ncbi:glycoside hydrolase family 43 protein [Paractinoplanes toevensis]|uniref:Beta-xylosidase n=1 Tax=Paractinoplanes toevensis TaxID=571911 RepID=A0A919T5S0_9ACTN|nr:glycoside hydrolase 43 family protein [Actinoplanes toevensis]GIM89550.1 beta-xylosidase [Actinoplanes toevensis]
MTEVWSADTGDGCYRNPVLFGDWSDPDVARAGRDFYLIASSFNRVPGLPVLHSTDLVNWRFVGHALQRLVPEAVYATPRHGCGVWAPALRYHAGRFWIVYPDPDHGIYVTTAADPRGPWTPPRLILAGRGLIDPCPLWDDDGNAYLVHAWAKSRCGFNNRLTAYRMTPDLTRPLDTGMVLVDGDAVPGCYTLEGPKWYRRDGWYWIFAPAGGVANGWQYAMRSRSVLGHYEPRVVLAQGDTEINGPHQGAWVDDWFVHFQDRGAYGRVVHLQPVTTDDEGWPVIGDRGVPVIRHRKPLQGGPVCAPPSGDRFVGGRPGPQWTWPANPQPGWLLPPGDDGLRMACVPWPSADLRDVPTVLGQRLPGPRFRAETTLRLDAPAGSRAGMVVRGKAYAWIGLDHRPGGTVLVCRTADAPGGPERDLVTPVPVAADAEVRLTVTVTDGAVVHLEAEGIEASFAAVPGGWIGATLGLFATARPGAGGGRAEFEPFRVAGPGDAELLPLRSREA